MRRSDTLPVIELEMELFKPLDVPRGHALPREVKRFKLVPEDAEIVQKPV
jgi:hypothetical protein